MLYSNPVIRSTKKRPSRCLVSDWISSGGGETRVLESRFLTSLFRDLTVSGAQPAPGRGVWTWWVTPETVGPVQYNGDPDVETLSETPPPYHQLVQPATLPWVPYDTWAESWLLLTNTISDNGASSALGAASISAKVELTATMEAYGETASFNPANAIQFVDARGYQGYVVQDGDGNPQLVEGFLTITYTPPTPGGRVAVTSAFTGADGQFFGSAFSAAGITNGQLWAQDLSPGSPGTPVLAEVNEATKAQTVTVNFQGVTAIEAVNYAIRFEVAAEGVISDPGIPGSYSGGGHFVIEFHEWIID